MAVSSNRLLHVRTQHFTYSITISPTTGSSNIQWSQAILERERGGREGEGEVEGEGEGEEEGEERGRGRGTGFSTIALRNTVKTTLSLRSALAPALSSNIVVSTSPVSAEKKRADHPVLCDNGERRKTRNQCHTYTPASVTFQRKLYKLHLIAERLSVRQLIPRRISEIVCMYVSVTLKNARMSHLGMQFYTTLPKD